jgi:cytoskeletal protein RodZ
MNKQNKKIAQEKRRIEREKAEKKAKVVNLLKFWVPVVAVVVVVIVLIWAVATSGGSSSKGTDETQAASQTTESQASETQSSDSQTEAATLNTETDTVAENGIKNAVKSGCFLTKFITYPPSQTVCNIAKAYNRLAYPNQPAYFCCRLPCLIYLMLYLMSYLQFYLCVPLI